MTETIMALLIAIRVVESTDGLDVRADGNNYQITRVCVEDVNRIYGTRYRYPADVRDEETAQNIAFLYLAYYADVYRREHGRVPSKDTLARIYNRGYRGAMRGEGAKYAAKVRKAAVFTKSRKNVNNSAAVPRRVNKETTK